MKKKRNAGVVRHRHSLGQSASVINIGAMGEVGFVANNEEVMNQFNKTGMRLMTENNLLDTISLDILRSSPQKTRPTDEGYRQPSQIITGLETAVSISSPATRVAWKRDMRMSIYHNINGVTETSTSLTAEEDGLKALLQSAESSTVVLSENDGTTARAIIAKGQACLSSQPHSRQR